MDGKVLYIPAVESAIKLYLKANGLTMQDMADRLGVSQQAVSGAVRRGIGVNTAKKWATSPAGPRGSPRWSASG